MARQAKKKITSENAGSRKAPATSARAAGQKVKRVRREQQRSIDTRRALLDAALIEFAENGFESTSMRRIGQRAGVDFTLIPYHFKNKDELWRAVAIDAFSQMTTVWDETIRSSPDMSAADRVKMEGRALLNFTIEHTAFHHFMLQENHGSSERLAWLIDNILSPIRKRILPQIRQAQKNGDMLQGDPNLIYYMLIGIATTPSSLKEEMHTTFGFSLQDSKTVEKYWQLMISAIFH